MVDIKGQDVKNPSVKIRARKIVSKIWFQVESYRLT